MKDFKIIRAPEDLECNAFAWIDGYGVNEFINDVRDDMTFSDKWYLRRRARRNGKILKGEKCYSYMAERCDEKDEFIQVYCDPKIDEICLEFDVYNHC